VHAHIEDQINTKVDEYQCLKQKLKETERRRRDCQSAFRDGAAAKLGVEASILTAELQSINLQVKNLQRESYFVNLERKRKRGILQNLEKKVAQARRQAFLQKKIKGTIAREGLVAALHSFHKLADPQQQLAEASSLMDGFENGGGGGTYNTEGDEQFATEAGRGQVVFSQEEGEGENSPTLETYARAQSRGAVTEEEDETGDSLMAALSLEEEKESGGRGREREAQTAEGMNAAEDGLPSVHFSPHEPEEGKRACDSSADAYSENAGDRMSIPLGSDDGALGPGAYPFLPGHGQEGLLKETKSGADANANTQGTAEAEGEEEEAEREGDGEEGGAGGVGAVRDSYDEQAQLVGRVYDPDELAEARAWAQAESDEGEAYYYNVYTHETSWVPPPGWEAVQEEERVAQTAADPPPADHTLNPDWEG
jgi:hypothetical protein